MRGRSGSRSQRMGDDAAASAAAGARARSPSYSVLPPTRIGHPERVCGARPSERAPNPYECSRISSALSNARFFCASNVVAQPKPSRYQFHRLLRFSLWRSQSARTRRIWRQRPSLRFFVSPCLAVNSVCSVISACRTEVKTAVKGGRPGDVPPTYPTYSTYSTYSTYPTYLTYSTYSTYSTYPTYPTYSTYPTYPTYPTYSTVPTHPTYPTYPPYPPLPPLPSHPLRPPHALLPPIHTLPPLLPLPLRHPRGPPPTL